MKILVFTSKYTEPRDIIDEDFERQFRLFGQLRKNSKLNGEIGAKRIV